MIPVDRHVPFRDPVRALGKSIFTLRARSRSTWLFYYETIFFDEDEVLIEEAPKVYEAGGSLSMIRD